MLIRFMPKFSIIMPVYHGMPYLPLAIDAILAQDCPDWELIIICDESGDGSWQYINQLTDARIIKIYHANRLGLSDCWNLGFQMAKGEFLLAHPCDDVSHRERLSICLRAMNENPNAMIIFASLNFINEQGKIIDSWRALDCPSDAIKQQFLTRCAMNPAAAIWRNGDYPQKYWRKAVAYTDDYDFILRYMDLGDIITSQEFLYNFRVHSGSTSIAQNYWQNCQQLLLKISHHQRRQGLPDFLDNTTDIICDWRVAFAQINDEYTKKIAQKHLIRALHTPNEQNTLIREECDKLGINIRISAFHEVDDDDKKYFIKNIGNIYHNPETSVQDKAIIIKFIRDDCDINYYKLPKTSLGLWSVIKLAWQHGLYKKLIQIFWHLPREIIAMIKYIWGFKV